MASLPRTRRRAESLAKARPPTPPLQSSSPSDKTAASVLPSSNIQPTPNSSAEAGDKSRKKVGWSGLTEFREPPDVSSSPSKYGFSPLTRSSERRAAKSILKPHHANLQPGPIQVDSKGVLSSSDPTAMLVSTTKQLASDDREARVDGYLTLSGVMKASENFPDPKALKDKAGQLTNYIIRDLNATMPDGSTDIVIVKYALGLATTLLWKQHAADLLSQDFCVQLVEQAIKAISDEQSSKDVKKRFLFILGEQTFPAKVLSVERTSRLITALHSLESRTQGKSITIGRIHVYNKLLNQNSAAMVANSVWVLDLLNDLLSNAEEVRREAVIVGLPAAYKFGKEKQVSKAVMDALQQERDGRFYADIFAAKLTQTVKEKRNAATQVPTIWSIVVLFLRCRSHQIEQWQFLKPWLMVLQACFNNSDNRVKEAANNAWTCLIFAVQPDEKTSTTMAKVLVQPIVGQLSRKASGDKWEVARRAQLRSVWHLVYQSMKPSGSTEQLNRYWDEYVTPLIFAMINPKSANEPSTTVDSTFSSACRLLKALFDHSGQNNWEGTRENGHAPEISEAEDLLSLNPGWLRKQAPRIFPVLEKLIEENFGELSQENSRISELWNAYITAVAMAGTKEIKVSNDTISFIACLLKLLYDLWEKGSSLFSDTADQTSVSFIESFNRLLSPVLSALGGLPFTERFLALTSPTHFTFISTPSHTHSKVKGDIRSPAQHLFNLFQQPPPGVTLGMDYSAMAKGALTTFYQVKESRRARLEFVRELAALLSVDHKQQDPGAFKARQELWSICAEVATAAIDLDAEHANAINAGHRENLGQQYLSAVSMLETGFELSPPEQLPPSWVNLFKAVSNRASIDAGDSGRALALVEPLASSLLNYTVFSPALLSCANLTLTAVGYPRDKHALDSARRKLWGKSLTGHKSNGLDPFVKLYDFLNIVLQKCYAEFNASMLSEVVTIITLTGKLLRDCPSTLFSSILGQLQDGVAIWVRDPDDKCKDRQSFAVSEQVLVLWTLICDSIKAQENPNSNMLRSFDQVLSAAFNSTHRRRVNATITLWNMTFGRQNTLEYPSALKATLLSLNDSAKLSLPSLSGVHKPGDSSTLSQIEEVLSPGYGMIDRPVRGPTQLAKLYGSSSPLVSIDIAPPRTRKRKSEETPPSSKRKDNKSTSTPRLSHNDSQIQFTTIESSPPAEKGSQLLTDRQVEIKERQSNLSALFPGMRSSSPVNALPRLNLSSDIPVDDPGSRGPSTPVLLDKEATTLDYWTGSSPTPRRQQANMQIDSDDYIPSSPPESVDAGRIGVTSAISSPLKNYESAVELDVDLATDRETPDLPVPIIKRESDTQRIVVLKLPVPSGAAAKTADHSQTSVERLTEVEVAPTDGDSDTSNKTTDPSLPEDDVRASTSKSSVDEATASQTEYPYETCPESSSVEDISTGAAPDADIDMGSGDTDEIEPGSPSTQLFDSMSLEMPPPTNEDVPDLDINLPARDAMEVDRPSTHQPTITSFFASDLPKDSLSYKARQPSVDLDEVCRSSLSTYETPEVPTEVPSTPPQESSSDEPFTVHNVISLLQSAARNLSKMKLSRDELRQVEDAFFETRRQMYAAGDREKGN